MRSDSEAHLSHWTSQNGSLAKQTAAKNVGREIKFYDSFVWFHLIYYSIGCSSAMRIYYLWQADDCVWQWMRMGIYLVDGTLAGWTICLNKRPLPTFVYLWNYYYLAAHTNICCIHNCFPWKWPERQIKLLWGGQNELIAQRFAHWTFGSQ